MSTAHTLRPTELRAEAPAAVPAPALEAPARLPAHIPALDGLRGLAILLVMLHHFTYGQEAVSFAGRWVLKFAHLGWIGVDLFFVLSGFLITGILLDAKGGAHYFRNFYARRVLRIFPLYYGVLAVLFGLLPLLIRYDTPELQAAWASQGWLWLYGTNVALALGVQGFNAPGFITTHFWSLAVEEHFYLLWPLVVFLVSRRALPWVCAAAIVGAAAARFAVVAGGYSAVTCYLITPCRVDGLAFGALLAWAARTIGIARLAKPAGVAMLVCVALWWLVFTRKPHDGAFGWTMETLKYSLLAIGFGLLLVLTVHASRSSLLGRVFCNPVFCLLGKIAYGLYVFHLLLRPWFDAWFGTQGLTELLGNRWAGLALHVALSILASVAVAWLSWHLFEKQVLKLKRYFEYRKPTDQEPGHDKPAPMAQAA